MNHQQHYAKAPIIEAIIDIRVTLPESVTLETLSIVHKEEQNSYPLTIYQGETAWELSLDPEVPTTANNTLLGYMYSTEDKRRRFQARLNGFTYNWLAPYESWVALRDEAHRLWAVYRSIARPEKITRVAVRYINRLDLPLPFEDFSDYLRTVPDVSPDLPQRLSGYLMQLHIPQDDLGAMLVLNEALAPSSNPDKVGILLDLDLFRDHDVPQEEAELWDYFEELRVRKNDVFEACLTERMKELLR